MCELKKNLAHEIKLRAHGAVIRKKYDPALGNTIGGVRTPAPACTPPLKKTDGVSGPRDRVT